MTDQITTEQMLKMWDDCYAIASPHLYGAPKYGSMFDAIRAALQAHDGLVTERDALKDEVERLKKVEANFAQAIKESGHYREQKARAEKAEAALAELGPLVAILARSEEPLKAAAKWQDDQMYESACYQYGDFAREVMRAYRAQAGQKGEGK